ncbi:hypothetical protein TNCV_1604981 [Trichonephila clavipes]|nr:hypothetical protein TNCV_1604981 [Trichonephila clavipes]
MALVPLERYRDKALSSVWSMIHLVSSSCQSPDRLAHCAYSHNGMESQEANKRMMTSKRCDLSLAHKTSHLLSICQS